MSDYEDFTDCPICPQLATDRDDALAEVDAAYMAGRQDGYNDGRTDRWADLLAVFRALNLIVAGDGATIAVDVSAIAGPHGAHRLLIEREAPESDVWHHYPSGVSGSLAEILIGVAWSYVRFPVDESRSAT